MLVDAVRPKREPTPNDTLVSPEVGPDKTVTFRIYAPKASEVTLRGDWMTGAPEARFLGAQTSLPQRQIASPSQWLRCE